MPQFKSTYNILKRTDEDEVWNDNWMDSDKLVLPPTKKWTYDRDMVIEDVDIWEIIYEASGGVGIYAAWTPYAEFYMFTTGWKSLKDDQLTNDRMIETYYGRGAQQQVMQRAKELKIPLGTFNTWVDPEDMWLYE
jgi:hypothetical protein